MDLVMGLDRARFRPFVVAPNDGPFTSWTRANEVPSCVVKERDWQGRRAMLVRAARLAGVILRTRAEIVHAMAPRCYRAAGLAGTLTGTARICHLGSPPTPGELTWSFRFTPDAVIACYEAQAIEAWAALRETKPRCRVLAIPNGIDTSAFNPAPAIRSGAIQGWRFGPGPVVVTVANLLEAKGYPILLRAAAKVVSELKQCTFVAIGGEVEGDGYRASLERLAEQLGLRDRIQFLGWRKEVAEALRAADVAVFPSLTEGLPLALLEAMACGRPVVATAVGGVPEVVRHELTGLLVPPRDVDALAAAVLRLLNDRDLAERMGREGRRRVEVHFTLERVLSRTQELYEALRPRAAGSLGSFWSGKGCRS
jgi:glycosyltransferase involved in cell wall biosynthesis